MRQKQGETEVSNRWWGRKKSPEGSKERVAESQAWQARRITRLPRWSWALQPCWVSWLSFQNTRTSWQYTAITWGNWRMSQPWNNKTIYLLNCNQADLLWEDTDKKTHKKTKKKTFPSPNESALFWFYWVSELFCSLRFNSSQRILSPTFI